jgi:hypothetical protein
MPNITVFLDDETYRRARKFARPSLSSGSFFNWKRLIPPASVKRGLTLTFQ